MNIDEITIKEAREIAALLQTGNSNQQSTISPYAVGDSWFFRTVTNYLSGEIKAVGPTEITLKGGTVCWIADTGRFADFFRGDANEKEPYGNGEDVVIGRGSIVDACRLKINIMVVQK